MFVWILAGAVRSVSIRGRGLHSRLPHTHTKNPLKLTFLGLRSHFNKVWHATESAPWHGVFGSRQLIRTPGARRRRRADMFPAGSSGQSRDR